MPESFGGSGVFFNYVIEQKTSENFLYFHFFPIFADENQKDDNMEVNDALVSILKKSHAQAMAGQAVAMEEVESFINEKDFILSPMTHFL